MRPEATILRFVAPAIAGLALFCPGCREDSPVAPPAPNDTGSLIDTNLTEPSAVIAAYARAVSEKDLPAYAALIDSEFEFYPHIDSAWLGEQAATPWGRTEELRMIERMFDENYSLVFEDEVVLEGAETIQFEATVLDVRLIENEQVEVTCSCRGYAVTTPEDMFVFRSRLLFTLIPREGYLRIRKIVESEEPGVRQWIPWGRVKGYYNWGGD